MQFPKEFLQKTEALLGPEFPAFLEAMGEPAPVSLRTNRFKTAAAQINNLAAAQASIPWHPDGFYLPERPVFTLDPSFHAGAYYVQEASSMFLHEALRQTVDFAKPLKILDLCAAPGGKSTLLLSMVSQESLLVANEVIRTRTAPLRENIEKWGCPNVAVVSAEASEFEALEGWFDVVVADAPCSGEGLFRKDPEAMREWSPGNVELCTGRQKKILASAVAALAPGGILAYSTCTFNVSENEENADWLAREFGLETLKLEVPEDWGIVETRGGYRFFPHRVAGEGFFVSLFRKTGGTAGKQIFPSVFRSLKPVGKNFLPEIENWVSPEIQNGAARLAFFQTSAGEILAFPKNRESDFLILDKHLKIKWFGTNIGEFKGKDFIPGHGLALSNFIKKELPAIELDRDTAIRFLKKETFDLPPGLPKGWVLARFGGLNLGWLKALPNRMNNYFPAERRIRMAF